MISYEIKHGRWNESRKLRHKLQRFEHNMRRAVAPAMSEAVQQPPVGQDGQTLGGYGRPSRITAEIFQLAASFGGNADVRVQAEAGNGGAPWAGWYGSAFIFGLGSKCREKISRARPKDDASLH